MSDFQNASSGQPSGPQRYEPPSSVAQYASRPLPPPPKPENRRPSASSSFYENEGPAPRRNPLERQHEDKTTNFAGAISAEGFAKIRPLRLKLAPLPVSPIRTPGTATESWRLHPVSPLTPESERRHSCEYPQPDQQTLDDTTSLPPAPSRAQARTTNGRHSDPGSPVASGVDLIDFGDSESDSDRHENEPTMPEVQQPLPKVQSGHRGEWRSESEDRTTQKGRRSVAFSSEADRPTPLDLVAGKPVGQTYLRTPYPGPSFDDILRNIEEPKKAKRSSFQMIVGDACKL